MSASYRHVEADGGSGGVRQQGMAGCNRMLATALKIEIAVDVNIFTTGSGHAPLTIEQSSALICKIAETTAGKKVAA